jgi:uncharacterized protein (TIGR02466 family)
VVDGLDEYGATALHIAAVAGQTHAATILLGHGAQVNARDYEGWTPLHETSKANKAELATLLLKAGASIGAIGPGSNTPLHVASANGCTDVVEVLLREVAQMAAEETLLQAVEDERILCIDARDSGIGATALHHAAFSGSISILKLLVAAGANITEVSRTGATVMHFASQQPDRSVDEYLLFVGATPLKKPSAWPHPPLTLLGFSDTYTEVNPQICEVVPPSGFSSHEVRAYYCTTSDEPATAHIYTFCVAPETAQRLNAALLVTAGAVAASGHNVRASNNGGFHSRRNLFEVGEPSPQKDGTALPIDESLKELHALILEATRALPRGDGAVPPPTIAHAWVNLNGADDFNGMHDHLPSLWSGAYYVHVPETASEEPQPPLSGNIGFRFATAASETAAPSEKMGDIAYATFAPSEGLLLIFSGGLKHAVFPRVRGAIGLRVSISFNVDD